MKRAKAPYFVLVGAENDSRRYRYEILKQERFTDAFIPMMMDLGFKDDELRKLYHDPMKNVPLKVTAFKDDVLYFKNGNYEIDLFYGTKKIVAIVRVRKKAAKNKLVKTVEKYSVWKKSPKKTQVI